MAERGVERPPYPAVRALAAWAALNWHYLRGRLLLAGTSPVGLSLRDLVDIAYVIYADGWNGWVNPEAQRTAIDEALLASMPERETWGMDVDDEALMPAPAITVTD